MTGDLRSLLGIDVPIVLGAFGGLSSIELTGLVSDRGGLGSYGLYGYAPDRITDTIDALRHRTDRPFAVNFWLPLPDEPGPHDSVAEFLTARTSMEPLFASLGLELPAPPPRYLPPFADQIDAVLAAAPAAVSFVYGVPSAEVVAAAHQAGIVVIGTATTPDEAAALEEGGVDAVIASGAEAAGHRVSFIGPAEDSLIGTFALVPQVVDAVTVPVIAAGGIADRRGVAAALALGASAVQVGTAFLRTRQSGATDAHRDAIAATPAQGTVLTRAMSGRLARGIPNKAIHTIHDAAQIAPFPVQNWLTGQFRTEAARQNDGDFLSLWAGQAGQLAHHLDANNLFTELAQGIDR